MTSDSKVKLKQKLLDIFNNILEKKECVYDGPVEDFDHYNMMWSAGQKDCLYNFAGNNLCVFNGKFEGEDAIIMLFGIPINVNESNDDSSKSKKVSHSIKDINERLIDIVSLLEDAFITLDYINSVEKPEEKFSFLFVVKKTKKELDD
jgi:hypothetical protein